MKKTKMKAMVWTKYGPPEVLQLQEVEKPTPKDNEVLIKIHAATVTAGDCELRRFDIETLFWLPVRIMFGLRKPKITSLGQELAGEIEAVGKAVTQFKKGDAIFALTGTGLGAYAEYKCQPASYAIALKPQNMSYEEAATIPTGGLNALYFLKKGNIQAGESVLINGAGGSIGTYGIQMAKALGAEVTAVDSAGKLDMLRSIGADHVIDYQKEDFTKTDKTYDIIFDVVGKSPYARSVESLNPNGRYLLAHPRISTILRGLWTSWTSTKKVMTGLASEKIEDLIELREMIKTGKLKAVMDRTYPLGQLVEAHQYVEQDKKLGNVAITIA